MTEVIITNSFRGGTGKSTIISNIGSYLASFGMKVVLIDADIISPGIHAMFGLDPSDFSKTLTDFLMSSGNIDDAVYDISENLELPQESLFLVPSSMMKGDIAVFLQNKSKSNKLAHAVELITKNFEPDFILIDTHPGLNEELLVASNVTDILLNVVRPDNQDFQGLKVSSDVTKKLGLKTFVILNKVHHKLKSSKLKKDVEKSFDLPVAGMLPFSDDIILAQSKFVFSQVNPEHIFSEEIHSIVFNVFGIKPKTHLEAMNELLVQVKDEKIESEKLLCKHLKRERCKAYIKDLLSEGFIEIHKGKSRQLYGITKKGLRFLKKYKSIGRFVSKFRL